MSDDVLILLPEGRQRVLDYLQQCIDSVFGDLHECTMLKGSVYKGDFIPYFSDLDVHVFLDSRAMVGPRAPKLEKCVQFQERLGILDPEEYGVSQFQIYFVDANMYPSDWTPPLPGTYEVVAGKVPTTLQVPDASTLKRKAEESVQQLPSEILSFFHRFADKPNSRIDGVVRLVGTLLKPTAYQCAILVGADPLLVWTRPLYNVVSLAEECLGTDGWSRFYESVEPWDKTRRDPDKLRKLFADGITTLQYVVDWWAKAQGSAAWGERK